MTRNQIQFYHMTNTPAVKASLRQCPGLAPEAKLFVFRGPGFQDLPFIDKVQEQIANGIIMVSAVGNDGPHHGLLSNPADQVKAIGVGGITKSNEIAEFSSRGMTTWELPFGSGRVKPDIVTLAEDVSGADASGRCKFGATFLSKEAERVTFLGRDCKEFMGSISNRKKCYTKGQDVVLSVFKPSSFPDKLDMTDCSRMWPYCLQPLYHSALPLMVNLTILNPTSVVGTIKSLPQWLAGTNGEYLLVSTSLPSVVWPYFGSIGVFVEVKEQAAAFEGIAQGTLRLELDNANHVNDVLIPITVKIIPTPPASKQILWDQFHNIPYPSAFVPRDNLENQRDLMDVSGDHPHTNFHQMWSFLASEVFFTEIMPFECSSLQAAVKFLNVSLIVFADWYDNRLLDSLKLFDMTTLSKWHAITGGANIPAINELLQDFHIAFGAEGAHSSSLSLLNSGNDSSFPYWSGSYLTNFPVSGCLGYIEAIDQSARTLNGSKKH
ncbi:unnamed protein product [Peronospora effusa]|nr:unnamed protein product [Peronospora effusa]